MTSGAPLNSLNSGHGPARRDLRSQEQGVKRRIQNCLRASTEEAADLFERSQKVSRLAAVQLLARSQQAASKAEVAERHSHGGATMSLTRIALLVMLLSLAACGSSSQIGPPSALYPELILTNAERRQEVQLKAARIVELLKRENLSGVLIESESNFSWVTAGSEGKLPLFVRDDGRKFFLARAGDAPGAVSSDLADMGYESRTLPWYSGAAGEREMVAVLQELSGGRPFGADVPCVAAKTVDQKVASLRVPLTEGELREYRWLGKRAAEAVEDVCRRIQPGMTDRGIDALLSDALLLHAIRVVHSDILPDVLVTRADGKPRHDVSKVERRVEISVCAERWGLRAALTRLVCFGPPGRDLQERLRAAARVNAGFWARTLPGASAVSVLEGAKADYTEAGYAPEWSKRSPGGAIGYADVDWPSAPDSMETVRTPQAFAWRATVGDVRIEDTILLVGQHVEVLTETPDWPRVDSKCLGRIYRSPGILQR